MERAFIDLTFEDVMALEERARRSEADFEAESAARSVDGDPPLDETPTLDLRLPSDFPPPIDDEPPTVETPRIDAASLEAPTPEMPIDLAALVQELLDAAPRVEEPGLEPSVAAAPPVAETAPPAPTAPTTPLGRRPQAPTLQLRRPPPRAPLHATPPVDATFGLLVELPLPSNDEPRTDRAAPGDRPATSVDVAARALEAPVATTHIAPLRRSIPPRERSSSEWSLPPGAVTIHRHSASFATRRSPTWAWIAALVLVGVGGYLTGRGDRAGLASAVPVALDRRPAAAGDDPALPGALAVRHDASLPGTGPEAARDVRPDQVASREARRVEAPRATSPRPQKTPLHAAPSTPLATRTGDRPAGPRFDPTAATTALTSGAARSASCTDADRGDVPVAVTFTPDGVGRAQVTGRHAATSVAACVEAVFGRLRVPPFDGRSVTVFHVVRPPTIERANPTEP